MNDCKALTTQRDFYRYATSVMKEKGKGEINQQELGNLADAFKQSRKEPFDFAEQRIFDQIKTSEKYFNYMANRVHDTNATIDTQVSVKDLEFELKFYDRMVNNCNKQPEGSY